MLEKLPRNRSREAVREDRKRRYVLGDVHGAADLRSNWEADWNTSRAGATGTGVTLVIVKILSIAHAEAHSSAGE